MSSESLPPDGGAELDVTVASEAGKGRKVIVTATNGTTSMSASLHPHEATQLAGRLVRAAREASPPYSDIALTVEEFGLMAKLIRRFAISEMDQWELFSVTADSGPLYVGISLEVNEPDAFHNIDGLLAAIEDTGTR